MTPTGRAALALILVAGAGPAGFLIYHAVFNSHPLPSHRADPPAAVNAGPAASAPAGAARATPLTVPDLALPDSNGKIHSLSEYRGHPLVLNFWATWCEPCQREIPLLQSMHQDLGVSVQIIGVAVDFQKDVLPFAQAHGITYPLLMGEKEGLAAVTAFGMDPVFPFTVFADDRDNIVAVKVGELHLDEAKLILGQVAAVDAGKMGLADARAAVSAGLRALAMARAQQPAAGSAPLRVKS